MLNLPWSSTFIYKIMARMGIALPLNLTVDSLLSLVSGRTAPSPPFASVLWERGTRGEAGQPVTEGSPIAQSVAYGCAIRTVRLEPD
jgi:hypothetical protein